MDAQHSDSGAHHQGIGLADKVGLFASSQFDWRYQGAAGGNDTVFRRTGQVGVGGDQAGCLLEQADGF